MNTRALNGLEGSIEKWEDVRDGKLVEDGSRNCPLCHIFFNNAPTCFGCPVREHTGYGGCRGTPYVEWVKAGGAGNTATTPILKEIATAEVDFLKSLLPK